MNNAANCPGSSENIQKARKDISSQDHSGESSRCTDTTWALASNGPPSPTSPMPIFEPRSFPPPSLVGVPVEYIIDQLHKLAPGYWDHPETADCTIIVPVPHHKPRLHHHEAEPLASPVPTYDATGRRATEPCINIMPRLTMNLHTDYLLAHSTFLRTILSDASPIDLINPSPSLTSASLRTPSGNYTIPPDRLPRLMPSSTATHPVLYVPVPDPSSVHLLIHWMYFGDTTLIHDALRRRVIHWEGIARNVEYLGLPSDIKVFLGQWYAGHGSHSEDEGDSETACGSDDGDHEMMDDMNLDVDAGMLESLSLKDIEEIPSRGRDRATRGLSWTSTHSSITTYSFSSSSSSPVSDAPYVNIST